MTGIAPAAPSAAPAAPATPDNPIAAAGEEYLASLTEEQRNAPLAGLDDDDEPTGTTTPAAPAPAEAVTDVGEPITRETDGAEWNESAERWQLGGKFVAGEAPTGWEAPAVAAPPAGAPAPTVAAPSDSAASAEAGVKVTLPGLPERGEEDIEVEVDPEIAKYIQRIKNEGLRAKEFQARRTQLDGQQAQIEAYEQEMSIDPIGFHLNKLPADQRLNVAQALLVEHLDELLPVIDQLRDPAVRMAAMRELAAGQKTTQTRLAESRRVSADVRAVVRAAEQLIPDGTDDATADLFIADARRDLANAADQRQVVTPQTVKQILTRRMALYGFDKPAAAPKAPAAPVVPVAPAIPTARPATDRARDIAARRPVGQDAAAAQTRIRRTQGNRAAAARVAPVGAGAAPTQRPVVPPEAETDIESMSRHLRKTILPGQGWGVGRE